MDGADGVYPSSEDTFLLIDALKKDDKFLQDRVGHYALCIEIGCGSGEVSAFMSSVFMNGFCLSTDVNVLATDKTKLVLAAQDNRNSDVVLCDLFTAFQPGVQFDLIVFNPPYVPTDHDELERALQTRDISAAWAGGKDGRQVIDFFLQHFVPFLSARGIMYLVMLEANNPAHLRFYARRLGLQVTTVMERRAGIEHLYILRFQRN